MSRRWRSENSSKMKPATKFAIVLVTAPDLKTARSLAQGAQFSVEFRRVGVILLP
jgi:hypothetical protein